MLAQDKDNVKVIEVWRRKPNGEIVCEVTYDGLSPDEYFKADSEVKPK